MSPFSHVLTELFNTNKKQNTQQHFMEGKMKTHRTTMQSEKAFSLPVTVSQWTILSSSWKELVFLSMPLWVVIMVTAVLLSWPLSSITFHDSTANPGWMRQQISVSYQQFCRQTCFHLKQILDRSNWFGCGNKPRIKFPSVQEHIVAKSNDFCGVKSERKNDVYLHQWRGSWPELRWWAVP